MKNKLAATCGGRILERKSTMPATMRGTPSATRILANPTTTPPKTIVRRDPFHLDDPQVSAPPLGQLLLRTLGRGARR